MHDLEYKKKIKRHKRTKAVMIIATVLFVITMVIVLYISNENKIYQDAEVINEIEIQAVENRNWCNLGDYTLSYTTDGANCSDDKGEVVWNRAYQLQSPQVDVCGTTVAISEYNATSIYVMNTQKELAQIDTGMPVKDFCVSEKGIVAAVLEDGNTTWIYLYDTKGEELVYFKTTMQDSGYPVKIDLSPNGMILGVSFITVQDAGIKTKIAFYNFGEVGQNKSDMLVSAYEYSDAVVPVIEFVKGNAIFALANGRLMIYGGSEIPSHKAETLIGGEIQSIVYSDDYIGLVSYGQTMESKYTLSVYNTKAELVGTVPFDLYYQGIEFDGDNILIYSDTQMELYKANGKRIYEMQFQEPVQKILLTKKDNKFNVVYKDTIETIELR